MWFPRRSFILLWILLPCCIYTAWVKKKLTGIVDVKKKSKAKNKWYSNVQSSIYLRNTSSPTYYKKKRMKQLNWPFLRGVMSNLTKVLSFHAVHGLRDKTKSKHFSCVLTLRPSAWRPLKLMHLWAFPCMLSMVRLEICARRSKTFWPHPLCVFEAVVECRLAPRIGYQQLQLQRSVTRRLQQVHRRKVDEVKRTQFSRIESMRERSDLHQS